MMTKLRRAMLLGLVALACVSTILSLHQSFVSASSDDSPVMVIEIDGAISPATDDFLRTSIQKAEDEGARLLVVKLNTPGGLLPSMQSMVENILEAKIPVMVYVSPRGGGAISAGVFITLAGHIAVMAPGTTIGAAHPVSGDGQDITGDMREKIENFAVSLITAISEQRGRNVKWAELAVRESVAITDREALELKVIDFIAGDLDRALAEAEGRSVSVGGGKTVTLTGLKSARRVVVAKSLKQEVLSILADPNIALLLGLGAMLGIGIELYHPGGILPGVLGVICLVLSLTASQVIPINTGGIALLVLGFLFMGVEMFMPSFGIWGVAGIICMIIGAIYFVDTADAWGTGGLTVNSYLVGSMAALVGCLMLGLVYMAINARNVKRTMGHDGLLGQRARAKADFEVEEGSGRVVGKVYVNGEYWTAHYEGNSSECPKEGSVLEVTKIETGMVLVVEDVS